MELEVDGHGVFAATGGRDFDPALPCAVFIHGAGMDHTVWYMQGRYFAHHGHSLLALDLPGHGRSGGPALNSIGGYADWTIRLLDAAGADEAALVGHSLGGLIALEAAARAPGRVSALALLGVSGRMPVHPDLLAAAARDDHLAFDLVTSWSHGRKAHVGHHPAPGLWMVGGSLRLVERSAPGVLNADLKACDDYGSAAEAAAKVDCPSLLILGEGDLMAPAAEGRKLADDMGGEAVVLKDCGHMMMIEQPDGTNSALRRVLKGAP